MRSKNSRPLTDVDRKHIDRVKSLSCSLCDDPPPSDAHHIKQGEHFLAVALCKDCHQGGLNGIHGQRRMWGLLKMDEIDALGITYKRLMATCSC